AVEHFPGDGVFLKSAEVAATLIVEHDDLGPRADFFQVPKAAGLSDDAASVHADPEAIFSAGLAGDAIVHFPLLDAPAVAPFDPSSKRRIIPIMFRRQIHVGVLAKA